ncbi:MAG: acyl carrier protein [Chitinophaga sp.]|uniref:acyl carrier protein n=1 Tax=Chitinophaga sp. TaxID=1869181 RepID=UPI001B096037|nr:acyl carrier protein [Chitinophaga sp.]MBO9730342.1 acyl carrier protein [Chitinophaga sp.]
MSNPTESKVTNAISELVDIPRDQITTDQSFEELGFTSILAVQLLSKLETAFDVPAPQGEMFNMRTVGEVVDYFQSKVK